MNLDLMKGFVAGLEGAELDATLDPAPGAVPCEASVQVGRTPDP